MLEPVSSEEFSDYPVFRLLDSHSADRIRKLLRPAVYSSGALIINEGQEGDALYLIRQGSVEVVKTLSDGEEEILATLPQGSLFGEVDFLLGRKRSATVRARGQVELLVLPRADFYELLQKRHLGPYQIIHYIAIVLAERLQETNNRISQLLRVRGEDGGISPEEMEELADTWKGGFSFLDGIDLEESVSLDDLLDESLPDVPAIETDPTGEIG